MLETKFVSQIKTKEGEIIKKGGEISNHFCNYSDFYNMYKNDMFFFHFLNPLLAFFTFLFFVKGDRLNWKEDFLGMVPMVIYSIFYVIFVLTHTWRDFYIPCHKSCLHSR